MLLVAEAVKVATPIDVPPKFKVPAEPLPFVQVLPAPPEANVVLIVTVPLLVTEAPVPIVVFGIVVVVDPLIDFPDPVKVCTPAAPVQVVALLVKLPPKLIGCAADSLQTVPELSVTSPVKVADPEALEKVIFLLIDEEPPTENA